MFDQDFNNFVQNLISESTRKTNQKESKSVKNRIVATILDNHNPNYAVCIKDYIPFDSTVNRDAYLAIRIDDKIPLIEFEGENWLGTCKGNTGLPLAKHVKRN